MTNYDDTIGLSTFIFCIRSNDNTICPIISSILSSSCNINRLRCLYRYNATSQGKNSECCR